MKQINKRTLAWSVLAVGVLTVTAVPDHYMFVDGGAKKVAAATVETSESRKEVLKLLLTGDKKENSWKYSAGAGELSFETAPVTADSVLVHITEENGKAGVATLEAKNVPVVTAAMESPWNGRALVIVEGQANVRTQPSEEAEIAGKVKWSDEAQVLEDGTEWVLISSGNLTGYVKREFLLIGVEAEPFADAFGQKTATVQSDGVFIRKAPDVNAETCDQAFVGQQYTYQSVDNGWVSITLKSGETGYISEQYVTTEVVYGHGITVAEEQAAIQAQLEAERKAAEEQAAKEKAAKEKAEAKKKAAKQAEVKKTQVEPTSASVDDLTLLAAIIELEAGSSYEGGIAVGNVVLNRVNSSSYPNTISGVIYQKGQFPGAHNGKLAKILARGPRSSSYSAAQAALNGENLVGGRLHFNMQSAINYNSVSNYVIIGGNCFY